jgi:predicted DNA-binding transcriptional regulator AlpA
MLLTIGDVLTRMHWSRTTLRRHLKESAFPQPAKVGGSVRFDAAEVDAWVKMHFAERDAQQAERLDAAA